jgi:3-oxoadipate enol-lactonase
VGALHGPGGASRIESVTPPRRPSRALSFLETGTGLPVVLIHAFPLDREMWGVQIPVLREHFRLIVPDLRGFGASPLALPDGDPQIVRVSDHATDVLSLLKANRAWPAVLVGVSLGGYVIFEMLRQAPDCAMAIVLADTQARPDDDEKKSKREELAKKALTEGYSDVLDGLVENLLGPVAKAKRATLVTRVRDLVHRTDPAAFAATMRGIAERPDSRPGLANIHVPALLLVGEDDAITPPELTEEMADGLPDAVALKLTSAGHLSSLENPLAFNESLRLFLSQRITAGS